MSSVGGEQSRPAVARTAPTLVATKEVGALDLRRDCENSDAETERFD